MGLDRSTPPAIHDAIEFDFKLPPIQQERLANGLPLYWLNEGVQEVAEINWVFPAGIWYEEKQGVAHAVAGLLKNGTSKHTAHQLHELLEFYGASLKANAGNDFSTVTLHALTKHLADLLPVVYEIITDATFPEDEAAIYKQNTIQRLMVNLRQCEFVANQQIDAFIFGPEHPYGRYTQKEKIEGLTREDLKAFYEKHYALANVKIFMAGRLDENAVKNVDKIFGAAALTTSVITPLAFSVAPHTEQKHHILNDPNGVQGAIRIGSTFPGRHHPDFAPMVVLNTLFGGYFGSRLMSNIREDKGYTYGIYSSLSPMKNGGSLIIHTEVGRDVIEPAINEIFNEMKLICDEPADDEELLLVKNYLLGGLLGDLDGPFSILQRWRTLILNDFTEEYFNKNIQIYKSITASELQELARKYLRPELFYELVVI
ncbi:M16 family metallopeptidase [Chitinophagaceae bacterium MMS25-I14]